MTFTYNIVFLHFSTSSLWVYHFHSLCLLILHMSACNRQLKGIMSILYPNNISLLAGKNGGVN